MSTSFIAPSLVVEAEKAAEGTESSLAKEIRVWEQDVGAARDMKREGGAAYGILGIILGIILVNGKILTDGQFSFRFPFNALSGTVV